MGRLFFMMESSRMMFLRLVLQERAKSSKSERNRYIEDDRHAPGSCLHQGRRVNRGNQYSSWQICASCGARVTYTSKGKAKAKTKAKPVNPYAALVEVHQAVPSWVREQEARLAEMISPEEVAASQNRWWDMPASPGGSPRSPQRTAPPAQRSASSRAPPPASEVQSSTSSAELCSVMQILVQNFQQLNLSMQDLARGQNQMLQVLQERQDAMDIESMELDQVSERASQAVDEMLPRGSPEPGSPESWTQVAEENPNAEESAQD